MGTGLFVKICGITTEADGHAAARFGADAIGLNFHPGSSRFINAQAAAAIVENLPAELLPVGIVVNPVPETLAAYRRDLPRIRYFQLYWDHPQPDVTFADECIPSFSVQSDADLRFISTYLEWCRSRGCLPPAILVDARAPGQYGGTGRTAPWHLLADFDPGAPLILAGGLNDANVAEAICAARPSGVDVATGIETSPGRKDPEKIRRFVENARSAHAGLRPLRPPFATRAIR